MPPEDKTPGSDPVEGRYANYFNVGHNAFEFVIEFAQLYSEPVEKVHTRIITSPVYAKELLQVLQKAVREYEVTFGPIPKHE